MWVNANANIIYIIRRDAWGAFRMSFVDLGPPLPEARVWTRWFGSLGTFAIAVVVVCRTAA